MGCVVVAWIGVLLVVPAWGMLNNWTAERMRYETLTLMALVTIAVAVGCGWEKAERWWHRRRARGTPRG